MAHEMEPQLETLFKYYGDFWTATGGPFFDGLYARGGLEPKTQELIILAMLAIRGWETGIRTHVRLALDAGATPDEIRGAIFITVGAGGVMSAASGLAYAEPVLQEYAESAAS